MKRTTLTTLAIATALTLTSNAATTISGTAAANVKGGDGVTNKPANSLCLLIVDTTGDGFLATSTHGALSTNSSTLLTAANDPGVDFTQVSITVGSTFGGDTIINKWSATTAGVINAIMTSQDITPYAGKSFAIIWFDQTESTLTSTGLWAVNYGIMHLSDWVLPAADNNSTYSLSTTDSNGIASYYSATPSAVSTAATAGGFITGSGTYGDANTDVKSATFSIVPEPSSALLGLLGTLGFIRR